MRTLIVNPPRCVRGGSAVLGSAVAEGAAVNGAAAAGEAPVERALRYTNLGALRLAAALRSAGEAVALVDAFALPDSDLSWGVDGAGLMGAPVESVLGQLARALGSAPLASVVVVAPATDVADPALTQTLAGLRRHGASRIVLAELTTGEPASRAIAAEVLAAYPDADAYVSSPFETEVLALLDAPDSVAANAEYTPAWDLIDLGSYQAFLGKVARHLDEPAPYGIVLPIAAAGSALGAIDAGVKLGAEVFQLVDDAPGDEDQRTRIAQLAEAAQAAGAMLRTRFVVGGEELTREAANQLLAFAIDLWDRFRAYPQLEFSALGTPLVPQGIMREFAWTFNRRLQASSGPEKVIMNLTYACNNHCTFCAVGTRTQFHGHTESQREHLLEYRKRGVTMVDFDGGEPTLHPDLLGTLRYARAIGYQNINVTTNGRLAFYEAYAKKLVRSGLTTLLFSVHGPDARSHAQQVGVAEAFDQTTAGIRNCVKFAPPGVELGMNITLTKSNTAKLEQLAQLAWDLGLRWLNVQFLTPFGRATSSIAPDIEVAAATTRDLIDRWRGRLKIQVINLPFCLMPGYEDNLEGDLLKLARHMIFVNNEDVNLAEYLAERRVRKPVCATCTRAVFCGGFYELESAPEPPWLVAPEDLVRKPHRQLEIAHPPATSADGRG